MYGVLFFAFMGAYTDGDQHMELEKFAGQETG